MSGPSASDSQQPSRQVPVAELRKGDRIDGSVFLVQVANFKQTRNNKYFIQIELRDRTGSIKAVRWEASRDLFASFSPNDFLRIRGRVEEFQQQLQIVVDALEVVPLQEVDPEDFLPKAQRDVKEMQRELLESVAQVNDEHLKSLLVSLLEDPEIGQNMLRCPAGKAMHHAYTGGLLEHILSLIQLAQAMAKIYPELNPDMLTTAAVVHDIGKVRELSYTHAFQYTDEGQLVGHIGIGIALIREKATAIAGFPEELLNQVLHIISSHHGLPEHGALTLPMTPEAVVFHFLDNLDAKLSTLRSLKEELDVAAAATEQDRKWTEYKPSLGRRFYFP